jgi:hypothetical protein
MCYNFVVYVLILHIAVMKWIIEQGGRWKVSTLCMIAAGLQSLEMLQYFVEKHNVEVCVVWLCTLI